jgi:hypothetical protein
MLEARVIYFAYTLHIYSEHVLQLYIYSEHVLQLPRHCYYGSS